MAHDALKHQLEKRLAVLQARLSRLKGDVTQSHSGDSAEQAQERDNDEVVDSIGEARLKAISQATRCLSCAQ